MVSEEKSHDRPSQKEQQSLIHLSLADPRCAAAILAILFMLLQCL